MKRGSIWKGFHMFPLSKKKLCFSSHLDKVLNQLLKSNWNKQTGISTLIIDHICPLNIL